MRSYGEHTCKRCGKAPIVTIPDHTAPPEKCRYVYRPKSGKRAQPELWNVFYPSEPHPSQLCNYCLRVKQGLFDLVPIVDIVRKMGRGIPLGQEDVDRYRRHQNAQAGDECWNG